MACPRCKCKTTYPYYEDDMDNDTDMERCANCGNIFFIEVSLDEDEYELDQQEDADFGSAMGIDW